MPASSAELEIAGPHVQGCAEMKVEAVDYVTPPPEGSSPPSNVVALVLDATAESSALEALKGAMLQVGLTTTVAAANVWFAMAFESPLHSFSKHQHAYSRMNMPSCQPTCHAIHYVWLIG